MVKLYDPIFNEPDFESSMLGLPRASGVYAVLASAKSDPAVRVLYIGSSKNIERRFSSDKHPYWKICAQLRPSSHSEISIFRYFILCDDYQAKEKVLIDKYKPRFNTVNTNRRYAK